MTTIFTPKNKIVELDREIDETYFFLNITNQLSFAFFKDFKLHFYRYADDPVVNSIDSLEKLNIFLQEEKP